MRIAAGGVVLGVAAVVAVGAWFATQHWPRPAAERVAEDWGLLKSYCVECHNSAELTAGIAFDAMNPEDVPNEAETFEHVVRKLRGGLMPPAGNTQPDAARVDSFVASLEDYLDESAAERPRAGRVGLQRLNRREYANAVRDLLGVEIDPAAFLPQDDASEGFDNNASTLTASPLFVSQFVDAARLVANVGGGSRFGSAGQRGLLRQHRKVARQRVPAALTRPRHYPSARATASSSRMHFRSPVNMRCRSRTWSGPSAPSAFSTRTESWSRSTARSSTRRASAATTICERSISDRPRASMPSTVG